MTKAKTKKIHEACRNARILYLAGPGDVVDDLACWGSGEDSLRVPAVTYSSQMYEAARKLGSKLWVVSSNKDSSRLKIGDIKAENLPFELGNGPSWHCSQLMRSLRMAARALTLRVDLVILSDPISVAPYLLLALLGKRLILSLHCTMYRYRSRKLQMLRQLILSVLWRFGCIAVLTHPGAAEEQLRGSAGSHFQAVFPFLPWYREGRFSAIAAPDFSRKPFRVLFIGRLVKEKGPYDILKMASRLKASGEDGIVFDVCGSGPEEIELRRQVGCRELSGRVSIHGYCSMLDKFPVLMGQAHALIAPTRPEITEGSNTTVIEAVLAGRPAIASSVCPAAGQVGEAAIVVNAGNIDGFVQEIVRLARSNKEYCRRVEATRGVSERFTSGAFSWQASILTVLDAWMKRQETGSRARDWCSRLHAM